MSLSYGYICGAGPQVSARRVELHEDRLNSLLFALILRIDIDEAWYTAENHDVREAIAAGDFTSGREHYIKSGYFEDRLPFDVSLDEVWYLKTYPDVAFGIETGAVLSARQHFLNDGFREGRLSYEGFSLLSRRAGRAT